MTSAVDRRRLLLAAGLAVLGRVVPVSAQSRVPRLAVVTGSGRSYRAILGGLRELGYVPGMSIDIHHWPTEGRPERYHEGVESALRVAVDVMVVSSTHGLHAATSRTKSVPVVVVDLETDPVAAGFVASLARPGANVSGLFLDVPEMSGKMLQLLKDAVPGMARVVVLWDSAIARAQFEATERAARAAGVTASSAAVRGIDDVEAAVDAAVRDGARALVVLSSPLFRVHQARVDDIALRHRMPSVTAFDLLPKGTGFLSYGPDLDDMFRRSASYVDRILKGARIGDVPVERPSKFNFAVNLKTARALGLAIPPSLLVRADQIIR